MTDRWSVSTRQQLSNAVLAMFAIPVEVHPIYSEVNNEVDWDVNINGGNLQCAIERMRKKQDAITHRILKHGLLSISRRDALFMYVSQWLEWTVINGHLAEDIAPIVEHMERWLVFYDVLNSKWVN